MQIKKLSWIAQFWKQRTPEWHEINFGASGFCSFSFLLSVSHSFRFLIFLYYFCCFFRLYGIFFEYIFFCFHRLFFLLLLASTACFFLHYWSYTRSNRGRWKKKEAIIFNAFFQKRPVKIARNWEERKKNWTNYILVCMHAAAASTTAKKVSMLLFSCCHFQSVRWVSEMERTVLYNIATWCKYLSCNALYYYILYDSSCSGLVSFLPSFFCCFQFS